MIGSHQRVPFPPTDSLVPSALHLCPTARHCLSPLIICVHMIGGPLIRMSLKKIVMIYYICLIKNSNVPYILL
jgi:hypothetical protein